MSDSIHLGLETSPLHPISEEEVGLTRLHLNPKPWYLKHPVTSRDIKELFHIIVEVEMVEAP